MDQIMGKVGSYWFSNKAGKELGSVTKDVSTVQNNISGGANWLVNKVKGTMQKPLPELLQEFDLPPGIFPLDATNYDFDEPTKYLTVHPPTVCEVGYKDSFVLKFSTNISGYLEKGKFTDIEGLKTKVVIWVKVTCIACEGSKVHFTAGLKKTKSRATYEEQKEGVTVDKF